MARLVAAASSLLQFRLALLSLLAASSLALLPHLPDGDVVDENILWKGAPQPLSFPDAVRLLQLLQLQQQEGQDQSAEGRAQLQDARFMSITDGGYFRGELMVYVPITVFLPTFAFRSRYSMAGKKHKSDWSSFFFGTGQSRLGDGEGDNVKDIRGPGDRLVVQELEYDPGHPQYLEHRELGALLSRMDAYFHHLRVHDHHCRMRLLCQLARHPSTFTPLSHLLLSPLKKSESLSMVSANSPAVFRFFRYYWAAERGVAGADCGHAYSQCPADLDDIVNMRVLNFWQNLASYVSIHLSDE
ncbi:uncharacterized protein [Procambarus clarkii]|uniref:uncharacterized protein n=1 Tax=Procambarus clarkii TaxID=6728 RepID=UPI00374369E7